MNQLNGKQILRTLRTDQVVFRNSSGIADYFITTETQKGHNYLRCTKHAKLHCSQRYVREEKIREAVTAELCLLAIPSSDADWMMKEVEAERAENIHARQDCIRSIRSQVLAVDEKLARLTEAMLATVISVDEYRDLKSKLMNDKQELKDKITELEGRRGSWFEPLLRFISAAKQAGILAERGSDEEKRDFLRKAGSNLTIADCHLSVVPREPWKRVVDQGRLAQRSTAPSCDGAALVGENNHPLQHAE